VHALGWGEARVRLPVGPFSKMKILYGLSRDGFGHSSRARTIIPYLEKKGHKVKVMTYGRAVKVLKKSLMFLRLREC